MWTKSRFAVCRRFLAISDVKGFGDEEGGRTRSEGRTIPLGAVVLASARDDTVCLKPCSRLEGLREGWCLARQSPASREADQGGGERKVSRLDVRAFADGRVERS